MQQQRRGRTKRSNSLPEIGQTRRPVIVRERRNSISEGVLDQNNEGLNITFGRKIPDHLLLEDIQNIQDNIGLNFTIKDVLEKLARDFEVAILPTDTEQQVLDKLKNDRVINQDDFDFIVKEKKRISTNQALEKIRTYDLQNKTMLANTFTTDYGFRTAFERLVERNETDNLDAEQLIAAIRREATITYNNNPFNLIKTFRGPDQARDSVYLVERLNENERERSVIKLGPDLTEEANITQLVAGHSNVINLIDRTADDSMIRLEYAPVGTLDNYIVNTEAKAKKLTVGIIDGLNHVHEQGVVHGDIGRANIFLGGTLDDPIAKIADFGESMTGDEAITNNLASDISGGVNLLRSLARTNNSPQAEGFIQALEPIQQEALRIMQKAQASIQQDPRQLAVNWGLASRVEDVTQEQINQVSDMLPAPGPSPTQEEISQLRQSFLALKQHTWLTNGN